MMAELSQEVAAIQSQINKLLESTKGGQNEKLRLELKSLGEKTVVASQPAEEAVFELLFGSVALYALVSLVRKGVLQAVVASTGPVTVDDLSSNSGMDKPLIVRLIRPLIRLGVVDEAGDFVYQANDLTKVLVRPGWISAMEVRYRMDGGAYRFLPEFVAQNGWKDIDYTPGLFEYANNGEDFFTYALQRPEVLSHFNNAMAVQRAGRPDWFTVFPAKEIIFDGASDDPESVFFIDVAGGEGHDIDNFAKAYPDVPGKLMLQELPPVLENIDNQEKKIDDRVIRQPHNFWEAQPVKGARAYYMRNILHDWADAKAVPLLKNLAVAMTPGYSKILINDWVLPPQGVTLTASIMDLTMMSLLSGLERTEAQWNRLMDLAGLKIVKIHRQPQAGQFESLIEVML